MQESTNIVKSDGLKQDKIKNVFSLAENHRTIERPVGLTKVELKRKFW